MNVSKVAVAAFFSFALCQAHAAVLNYSITVAPGGWFGTGAPFGITNSTELAGSITVDNALSGIAALEAFSLTTGTKTWTKADYQGTGGLTFDGSGNLVSFGLEPFVSGAQDMYIYANNTFAVHDGPTWAFCNGCVSFQAAPVPEPETYAMLLAGLGLLGFMARGKKSA
jgi:hypothetical protein